MGAYRWRVLQEPPYSPECWKEIMDALADERLRPVDRACAYAGVAIDKVAHRNLLQEAPDVAEMLKKMTVGLEPLNDTGLGQVGRCRGLGAGGHSLLAELRRSVGELGDPRRLRGHQTSPPGGFGLGSWLRCSSPKASGRGLYFLS